jgi:hypothetical protein
MISLFAEKSIVLEGLTFELPASPTLIAIYVQVRRCGDKALLIEPPQYKSR